MTLSQLLAIIGSSQAVSINLPTHNMQRYKQRMHDRNSWVMEWVIYSFFHTTLSSPCQRLVLASQGMCNSMAQALTNETQLQNGLCIYFSVSLLSSCLRKYSCSLAIYQFCLGHAGDFGMMIKCCICCYPGKTSITGASNMLADICGARNSQAAVIMTIVAAPTASGDIQNPFRSLIKTA